MRTTRSRGASIFAAIVLAALLAGVGYVAGIANTYTMEAHSQGASVESFVQPTIAPAKAQDPNSSAERPCESGMDYKISPKDGGQFSVEPVRFCPTGDPVDSTKIGSRGCKNDGKGQWAAVPNWSCKITSCVNVPDKKSGKTASQCVVAGNATKGENFTPKKVTADHIASLLANGQITQDEAKSMSNPLVANSADQDILDRAFKQAEIKKQLGDLTDQYQKNLYSIQQLGCESTTADNMFDCNVLNTNQVQIEKQAAALSDQYEKLAKAQDSLTPADGSPPPSNPPPGDQPNPCKLNPGTCTDKPYNPNNRDTGFDDTQNASCSACKANPSDRNACTQCAGRGPASPGNQGGQRGGSPSGGQQQQCQPKYFCNNNSIMYAPCYNQQPGNAQQVQQCPQNYTCSTNTNSNSCQPSNSCTPPPQPAANLCTVGSWTAVTGTNGCVTSWQCTQGNQSGVPAAQLSCQPKVADAGMTITFSFACTNATGSNGSGFDTGNQLNGSTTTVIQLPTDGSNSVNYTLSCTAGTGASALSSSAQCSIQTGKPSIMLVATPEKVPSGQQAAIGWVTVGQRSCTISDPDFPDWTAQNASNTSVAGAATTPVITSATTVYLNCKTVGGASQQGSVRLSVI